MTLQPGIEPSVILDALRQAYGLEIESLTFLLHGWASLCYRVDTAAGESYMLKLYDNSLPTPLLATSRDFYLPLCYQLCTRQVLPQVPCPVRAVDGRFWVATPSFDMILLHFIEGEAVGFGNLSDDILAQLAPQVGRLHRSMGVLDLVNPLVEDFRISFEDSFPAGMRVLAGATSHRGAGYRGFQELLVPRSGEIMRHLKHLKELQAVMRSRHTEKVVCHADLHGGNLLLDRSGDLHILDWEGAIVAPPEQDLFFFTGKDLFWELFWPKYKQENPSAHLDLDALGFYYYRRGLEDLAEWVQSLLHTNQTEEQLETALHWATVTVDGLPGVEETLGKIAAHLEVY